MIKRNKGIDILRFICAFLVVCIHAPFPGVIGGCIKAIARIAVPVFFLSTGYFLVESESAKGDCNNSVTIRGYKRLTKILKLIVFSNGFYFVVRFDAKAVSGEAVQYVTGLLSADVLRDVLIFNQSPFCEPLWYLNAILYAVAAVLLIERVGLRKVLYRLAPILIVADLALGKYSIFFFGRYFPNILTRNWLFFSLPNVAIGMMIREWGVPEKVGLHRRKLLILTMVFLFGLITEHLMLDKLGVKAERDNYVFAVLLSITVFLLFSDTENEGNLGKRLARFGQTTSTGIYIIHPFFIMVLPVVLKRLGLAEIYSLLRPAIGKRCIADTYFGTL